MKKALAAMLFMLVAALPVAAHARVFFGFGFGFAPFPSYYPPPYYYAPAYYPPPYYAAPAYVAPTAAAPATTAVAPSTSASRKCRTFRGDATMDGSRQAFYGTACLQADGKWHIVP